MSPYASEYTPELGSNYLSSLLNPISEEEQENVGRARTAGKSAGLIGQASMGSEVGAAEANAGNQRNSTVSKFGLDVAGAQRGERMTDEKEAYDDTEKQKDQAFQEHMLGLEFQHQDAEAAGAKHAGEQGELLGIAGSVVGGVAGSMLGPAGTAVGSAVGKTLASSLSKGGGGGEPGGGGFFGGVGAAPESAVDENGNAIDHEDYLNSIPSNPNQFYDQPGQGPGTGMWR